MNLETPTWIAAVLFTVTTCGGCNDSRVQDHLRDLDRHISAQSWQNAAETIDGIEVLKPVDVETWRAVARKCAYDIADQIGDLNEYQDRYKWVARAVSLLRTAAKQTDNDPRILYDLGTILAERIGYSQSPESQAFRKYFAADEKERFDDLPRMELDNLLVAEKCFTRAQVQLDSRDSAFRESFFDEVKPEVFYAQEPLCKAYYALALENEGIFGEMGRRSWQAAQRSWQQYGNREIPTVEGQFVRLQEANGDCDFWTARCQFGAKLDVLLARTQLYQASAKFLGGDIEGAYDQFESGFTKLAPTLKRFPMLLKNEL